MIAIRTDANKKIAMGHIMRCLSIANQLKKLGEEAVFFTSGDYAADFIKSKGFECFILPYEYKNKNEEIYEFIDILKDKNINMVLLDSYEVTEKYMSQLNEIVKVAYIDDLNLFKYPADLIINYTYNTDMSLYNEWQYNLADTKFLLGSKYIPLRSEFSDSIIMYNPEVKKIFITTGGADEYNMLLEILQELCKPKWSKIETLVIAGKFYEHIAELKDLEKHEASVKVYHDISDMAGVMKQCDIAISAGGTTIAELCACGIPTIGFAVAQNQIYGLEAYSKDGIIKYAGDVRKGKKQVIENIEESIEEFVNNYDKRKLQGNLSHNIIDGDGAKRIASEIMLLKENRN